MTNLFPFIQGSLEWPFSELFSANVSLWNQYKYIEFNIFSCRILIAYIKCWLLQEYLSEEINELNINGILCQNVTIFYRQELASLLKVQGKLKACRNSKWNFSCSCFVTNYSHVEVVWLVVFSGQDILNLWDNVNLFQYYPVKVPQNYFNYFNCSNQTCIRVSKFSLALDE